MSETTEQTITPAPKGSARTPNFQRDAVVLTAAMLGIADFGKSDPQAIIEATSVLYGGACDILYRMHGEETTRNMETLEALAEQDYEGRMKSRSRKPKTGSVTMAEALNRKKPSLSRIGHEH